MPSYSVFPSELIPAQHLPGIGLPPVPEGWSIPLTATIHGTFYGDEFVWYGTNVHRRNWQFNFELRPDSIEGRQNAGYFGRITSSTYWRSDINQMWTVTSENSMWDNWVFGLPIFRFVSKVITGGYAPGLHENEGWVQTGRIVWLPSDNTPPEPPEVIPDPPWSFNPPPPQPPPEPPPEPCDIAITVDPLYRDTGHFCMSFSEYNDLMSRFPGMNRNIQQTNDLFRRF